MVSLMGLFRNFRPSGEGTGNTTGLLARGFLNKEKEYLINFPLLSLGSSTRPIQNGTITSSTSSSRESARQKKVNSTSISTTCSPLLTMLARLVELYQLLDISQYHYLNQSGCTSVPTIDDASDYERVRVGALFSHHKNSPVDHALRQSLLSRQWTCPKRFKRRYS